MWVFWSFKAFNPFKYVIVFSGSACVCRWILWARLLNGRLATRCAPTPASSPVRASRPRMRRTSSPRQKGTVGKKAACHQMRTFRDRRFRLGQINCTRGPSTTSLDSAPRWFNTQTRRPLVELLSSRPPGTWLLLEKWVPQCSLLQPFPQTRRRSSMLTFVSFLLVRWFAQIYPSSARTPSGTENWAFWQR